MSTEFDPKALCVADFMTDVPSTADEDLTLEDARERMYMNNIRHLCVVRGSKKILVGIISQRDIAVAEAMNAKRWKSIKVRDAMTADPITVAPDASIEDVARLMEDRRLGSVIIAEDKHPKGVFTTTDAMRVIRSLVAGKMVEPVNPSTHRPPKPGERVKVEHYVRMRTLLDGAAPSPNMGTIGRP